MSLRTIFALCAFAAFANAAHAVPKWNGAGWYVVGEDMAGGWVEAGPYASKDACDSALPADTEDEIYGCEYLATRPNWDE